MADGTMSEIENPSEISSRVDLNHQESYYESTSQIDRDTYLDELELSYENLNDQVAALLKKSKGENGNNKDIKRRQRKTPH